MLSHSREIPVYLRASF